VPRRGPPNWRLVKESPASEAPGSCAKRSDCGGKPPGTAQPMSHYMSNFVRASNHECLSLVTCFAFECGGVRRLVRS
jgi:hypothetical protein